MRAGTLATAALIATAPLANADLVVLQYHHVSDSTPAATSTTPSLFEDQLGMIESLGLEVVALESGTRAALAGELDNRRQVAITFDDAYSSVYQTAAPLLFERGFPFTVFVNTDAVGRRGFMTWDQLAEFANQPGVLIANHSKDHGHLAQKPGEPEDQWQARITASLDGAQTALEDRLNVRIPMHAYPYGEFDHKLEQAIAERDWLGFGQQSGPIGATSGITRLPRFPMATAYGQLDSLEHKLLSKALPVAADQLPSAVISDNPPELAMTLPDSLDPGRLTCFASGQGKLTIQKDGQQVAMTADAAFNSRRFRYNCTYPAGDGRFYWLSHQWVNLSQPED
ncbi:polysaccharide deacetylase family protein [Marinobacter changyiensis]|uniref:polysaccharide deacetylase family protein n=1 Tax=Marinobacter changyiensis TaxID=2604091 RepID=UPI001264792A|nr:polysaccharide deacetylase family protein [Marinobacter changyiensis]